MSNKACGKLSGKESDIESVSENENGTHNLPILSLRLTSTRQLIAEGFNCRDLLTVLLFSLCVGAIFGSLIDRNVLNPIAVNQSCTDQWPLNSLVVSQLVPSNHVSLHESLAVSRQNLSDGDIIVHAKFTCSVGTTKSNQDIELLMEIPCHCGKGENWTLNSKTGFGNSFFNYERVVDKDDSEIVIRYSFKCNLSIRNDGIDCKCPDKRDTQNTSVPKQDIGITVSDISLDMINETVSQLDRDSETI